jgi:putative tributyrin esterase
MALIHCNFYSTVLDLSCSMDAIIPEPARSPDGKILDDKKLFPVLYLLHGLSDDHTIWQRRTSIERYVRDYNLAVIMPAVDRSFYTDMARGKKYGTFISEELPNLVRFLFPISTARKDTFVAGLSMGGYGAMKLALTYPDRYAAAASLSGALDISQVTKGPGRTWQNEMKSIFGDLKKVAGSPNDLFTLAEHLANSQWKKMPLYICCGTEDFLIDSNHRFRDHAKTLGLNYKYEEEPAIHDWAYWDQKIQRVLEWLPSKNRKRVSIKI